MNARDYQHDGLEVIVRISGSNSRNSPNLFEPNSLAMLVIPVILPPGRFKLATIPSATGSLPAANTMGFSVAELVACTTFERAISPTILDSDVLALHKPSLFQTLAERVHEMFRPLVRGAVQRADHRNCRLLRARREWPRRRHASRRFIIRSPRRRGRAASAARQGRHPRGLAANQLSS